VANHPQPYEGDRLTDVREFGADDDDPSFRP